MSYSKLKKYVLNYGSEKDLIDTLNGMAETRDRSLLDVAERFVNDGNLACYFTDVRNDLIEYAGISKRNLNKLNDDELWGLYTEIMSGVVSEIYLQNQHKKEISALFSKGSINSVVAERLKEIKERY